MGCVLSSIDEEETVRICKERKRLMKQLVYIREEFSEAQLAYLKALRNTGATLRQFTESDSLEIETSSSGLVVPPSPPPRLPPSPPPPPPPPFIYDPKMFSEKTSGKGMQVDSLEKDDDSLCTDATEQNYSSTWDYYFDIPSSHYQKSDMVEKNEEDWSETQTEFEDDNLGAEDDTSAVNTLCEKQHAIEPINDNSSSLNLCTKGTKNMTTVASRSKKTFESIFKELDDYFLKASACVKDIAVLIDINGGDILLQQNSKEQKRKRSNSAKVFSVLSWKSSSRSFNKDASEFSSPSEPCKPGAHCVTLNKIYAAEKRLCKEVKEEEVTKLEYERKSVILQKQEAENIDWANVGNARSTIESLESDVIRLQQLITQTTSSIVELVNEELYPQLVALASGLTQMWRTICECHQAQTHISQQLSHLSDNECTMPNSENHHQATIQLETEVNYWYNSFCKLVKSQREYARTLCQWFQLTNNFMDVNEQTGCLSVICGISRHWETGLNQLPDKAASDAIKSLLSSIHSIIVQQTEEDHLQKKLERLENRLQKELESLDEMGRKFEWNFDTEGVRGNLSPKHPLSLKREKTEALRKQFETERAKYLNSVHVTKVMTLNNLKNRLPHVFQSLMTFASASAEAFEIGHSQIQPAESSDIASLNQDCSLK